MSQGIDDHKDEAIQAVEVVLSELRRTDVLVHHAEIAVDTVMSPAAFGMLRPRRTGYVTFTIQYFLPELLESSA